MLSKIIKRYFSPKYQICLITRAECGTTLRHLYTCEQTGTQYFSCNHANNYTYEQAKSVLATISQSYPDAFIQSEYDCHYRETDRTGTVKEYMA